MNKEHIEFTPEKLVKFKEEYSKAKVKHLEVFEFDGSEFLTTYAKYLIEYLNMVLYEDV